MEPVALLFSVLFFLASAAYAFFGIYITHLNPKGHLNRLFLIVSIALSFWAFGFAMANSALNFEACLQWRRFSAIGWTTVYSLLLHFFFLLTREDERQQNHRYYWFLHLPALVNLYVFSLSPEMSAIHYNLVKGAYGWVNVGINSGWDWFFNIYYLTYVLACMGLLWDWKRRVSDPGVHKQAHLIFLALFTALCLGSLTDVILSKNLHGPVPQMAPLFTLLPIAAIYYSIKRYRLMQDSKVYNKDLILDEETRAKLYYYLFIAFIAGGFLTFLSYLLPHLIVGEGNLASTINTSFIFFMFGLAILIIRKLKDEKFKGVLITAIALISIPLVTLRFLEFASITVWAFPLIIMMVALISDTRIPIVLVTAMAIFTQVLVWWYAPKGFIHMDEFDYIIRIGIFLLAFWIGSVINHIYIKRLEENIEQLDFQKIIAEISFDFVSLNQANRDEKINHMLKRIGQFFQVDRTYLFLKKETEGTMAYTHEWSRPGIDPQIGNIKDRPLDGFSWCRERLEEEKMLYIPVVDQLPEAAKEVKTLLTEQKIKTVVVLPIQENGELLGRMGLATVTTYKAWSYIHFEPLRILSTLLADGLIKLRAEEEIKFMAYYDQLTGLPNRTLFSDRLNQALRLAERTKTFISVVLIDLDSFKMVNDTMGHSGGDMILKEVAQALKDNLCKSNTVARFGGDEFLILVNNLTDNKDIIRISDKLMRLFEKPFLLREQEFYITASAGVAVYPFDGEDAGTLIKNADIAMFQAKLGGKNQYVLCTEEMKDEVKQNILLSNDLFRALERKELMVYYQPQVDLKTEKIIGVEALLRWKHPKIGLVSPGVFIPLAEKNGLINPIGNWVLKEAIVQTKRWQGMGFPQLRVAVNLSASQLNHPHFADIVDVLLKETGFKPAHLEFEITESIAIKQAKDTITILNKLKKLGLLISIDDFGTEYSSLGRLKLLPIDRIKIDMQFIQGLEANEKDQAITQVIINLAKSLGLKVLAEGVETVRQAEFLLEKKCDEVQGYHYYKPVPAEEVEKFFKGET